jgi:hypothetical protein
MAARYRNAQIYFKVIDKVKKDSIKLGPRAVETLFNNEYNGYGNKVEDGVEVQFWRIRACGLDIYYSSPCAGVATAYPSKFMDPTKVNDSELLPIDREIA